MYNRKSKRWPESSSNLLNDSVETTAALKSTLSSSNLLNDSVETTAALKSTLVQCEDIVQEILFKSSFRAKNKIFLFAKLGKLMWRNNMPLTFEDLLKEYTNKLDYASSKMKENGEYYFTWVGYRDAIFDWFESTKKYCIDYDPKIIGDMLFYRDKVFLITSDPFDSTYVLHYKDKIYSVDKYSGDSLGKLCDFIDLNLYREYISTYN